MNALRQKYSITVDRKAKKYIDISLKWYYIQRTVTVSIPEYVKQAIHKVQHTLPTTPEYAPHAHVAPTYGQQVQYEELVDTSDLLPPTETNLIQKVVGTFIYYGLAIYNTILVALEDISLEQSTTTKNTSKKDAKLLNYLAKNLNASIQYHESDTILYVHSDASYLSITK